MTQTERLMFDDCLLESLDAVHAYDVEREMLSAVLAICHAQQVEIATVKRQRDCARAELARYTRSCCDA